MVKLCMRSINFVNADVVEEIAHPVEAKLSLSVSRTFVKNERETCHSLNSFAVRTFFFTPAQQLFDLLFSLPVQSCEVMGFIYY